VKVDRVNDLLDDRISPITRNLFTTLAVNGRIGEADRVVEDFLELMEAARGAVSAVVRTAEPLKKKDLGSIEEAVRSIVGEGKTVDLTVEEDPELIGGLQIRIGDQFLDMSIASRIAEMRRSLLDSDA
jgi:ATP synthase F1 delta subunit